MVSHLLLAKTLALALCLVMSVIGFLLPLRFQRLQNGKRFLSLSNCIAGGFFIGAGLVHMIPAAMNEWQDYVDKVGRTYHNYPFAMLAVIGGFVIVFWIDKVLMNRDSGIEARLDFEAEDAGGEGAAAIAVSVSGPPEDEPQIMDHVQQLVGCGHARCAHVNHLIRSKHPLVLDAAPTDGPGHGAHSHGQRSQHRVPSSSWLNSESDAAESGDEDSGTGLGAPQAALIPPQLAGQAGLPNMCHAPSSSDDSWSRRTDAWPAQRPHSQADPLLRHHSLSRIDFLRGSTNGTEHHEDGTNGHHHATTRKMLGLESDPLLRRDHYCQDKGHVETGHHHHHFVLPSNEGRTLMPYVLTLVLCFHSFILGMALGVQDTLSSAIMTFVAIVAHKGLEAYALGISFVKTEVDVVAMLKVAPIYVLMTPLGGVVGIVLEEELKGAAALATIAVLDGLAGGTFLYAGIFGVLVEEFTDPTDKWAKFFLLLLGVGFMCVVAIWA